MIKPELVCPAGDFEKMKYAIAYGADSVYLAGKKFGMRASSGNFFDTELEEAVKYAHGKNVRVYLACNIFPNQDEIREISGYLEYASSVGVDAVIAADPGVISLSRKYAPKLEIHISTQANVTNSESAKFYHSLGAKRIVPARELSMQQLAELIENIPHDLQIEAFVHGAMCVSVSGRCLISHVLTGRSANHGQCAQPCRWGYTIVEETRPNKPMPIIEDSSDKATYLYNSHDLCMIRHIKELCDIGVDAFKIEGRSKTFYYAASSASAYRRAIDLYAAGEYSLPNYIIDETDKTSHRTYSTGFYFGEYGQNVESSQYMHNWDVVAVFSHETSGTYYFKLKNRINEGDQLEMLSPEGTSLTFTAKNIAVPDENGSYIKAASATDNQKLFSMDSPPPTQFSIIRRRC